MIGNDRLYQAVKALATDEKDVRARVCLAMSIIDPIRKQEFLASPHVWAEIDDLKKLTSYKGPQKVGTKVLKDSFVNTAIGRKNATYSKFAKRIFELWLSTISKNT